MKGAKGQKKAEPAGAGGQKKAEPAGAGGQKGEITGTVFVPEPKEEMKEEAR